MTGDAAFKRHVNLCGIDGLPTLLKSADVELLISE